MTQIPRLSLSQVRSLASETARQDKSGKPALAWFAADFKEEMSAFDGAILVSASPLLHPTVIWCALYGRELAWQVTTGL